MTNFTFKEIKAQFPHAIERTYGAGQIIIYDGDSPNHVIFILKGAVKFYDTDDDGNEKLMHIGGEGSLFPLFYSFEDKPHVDAFYAALTETHALLVPLADFQNKLKTSVDYTFRMLKWYATEMDHIVLRLKSMEKSTAKQKILQAFYYLSTQHASPTKMSSKWYRVTFPLTQQTIADFTGLTRETVNITLKDPELAKNVRIRRQTFEINQAAICDVLGIES